MFLSPRGEKLFALPGSSSATVQFIGEVEEESHGLDREQNITNQEGPKLLFDALGNFIGAASCSHSHTRPG